MKKVWSILMSFTLAAGLLGCGKEQVTNMETVEGTDRIESTEKTESTAETLIEKEEESFTAYDSLGDLTTPYGFTLGAVIGSAQMMDADYKELIIQHFNSVTASNEMKAYSLLDQKASQNDPEGMPGMNYEKADEIVSFAADNGLLVRGHTLVWDAYMTDWFFREGYDTNGAYADKETMKARLQSYIEQVMSHFETLYPGVVYCWDVVNEAVADGEADCEATDARRVRKLRNGTENPFYTYVGADYVELAFLYARDTVEKLQAENADTNILLFYNDYNTFYDEKRDAVCELINSINSYAQDENGENRKLCDGIGMQSYIGGYGKQSGCMNSSDLNLIEKAIALYGDMGLCVQATELAVRNYEKDDYMMEKHASFYEELFSKYIKANEGEDKPLTGVTIWGLCDDPWLLETEYGYKMNGPYCGLFDEHYNVKESFKKVYWILQNYVVQ